MHGLTVHACVYHELIIVFISKSLEDHVMRGIASQSSTICPFRLVYTKVTYSTAISASSDSD